jgi:hypothetical protein
VIYRLLIRNCRKESKKFDTDKLISRYYSFYKKVSHK